MIAMLKIPHGVAVATAESFLLDVINVKLSLDQNRCVSHMSETLCIQRVSPTFSLSGTDFVRSTHDAVRNPYPHVMAFVKNIHSAI